MKDGIEAIEATVKILDSIRYRNYGDADNYLDYFEKFEEHDEKRLIQPIIFPKFLEQVLGFTLGEDLWAEEADAQGNYPDFLPVDTFTHSFVFDTKSSIETQETLRTHRHQIARYMEAFHVQYGVLCNMRDVDVYKQDSPGELAEYDFSFIRLYKDFKENRKRLLTLENTKGFLNFVAHFSYKEISATEKIEKLCSGHKWVGNEPLNVDLLISRLKHIVTLIEHDVRASQENLVAYARTNESRGHLVAREIDVISKEIKPGDYERVFSQTTLTEMFDAPAKTIDGRAVDIFFYRVAYFAMTRILLARVWEDIGFIESTLVDGGFNKWYSTLRNKITRVLKQAFLFASERYSWLFQTDNNYTWYQPSEGILVEVLYELSHFFLGNLKDDALGAIYEEELDKTDKQNKGQYYTPRPVIQFIWNRVGYCDNRAFFEANKKGIVPRKVLDPATGSGGFLVHAAKRLRELSTPKEKTFKDWMAIRQAILMGLHGVEISPFPYYITEVNVLIQLTPVIRHMIESYGKEKRGAKLVEYQNPLAIVQADALTLYSNPVGLLKSEPGVYKIDEVFNLVSKDEAKKTIFRKMFDRNDFDYCCANPPYIREDDHKDLFRKTKKLPIGQQFYQGKMDYLFFFIELGLSKLREGGQLCFITTSYWLAAVGGTKLREYVLQQAQVLEVVDFGKLRLFENSPGQFNIIFRLRKCSGDENRAKRADNNIKVVQVKESIPGKSANDSLRKLLDHIQQNIDKSEYYDKHIHVYVSAVRQGELDSGEWAIFVNAREKQLLEKIMSSGDELRTLCEINQGLLSGADTVTAGEKGNIHLLSEKTIADHGIRPGQGIFYLSRSELHQLRLSPKEMALIKPLFKPSNITPYYTHGGAREDVYCIYVNKNTAIEEYPSVKAHLEKFRAILENKRECREGKLPWFSMHWPRNEAIFTREKLMVSKWPAANIFGYSSIDYHADANVYLLSRRKGAKENLKYVCGLLNSALFDFWFRHKVTRRGEKFFFAKEFCEKLPIRKIDIHVAGDRKLHDHIVAKVDTMISLRGELFSLLGLVKDAGFFDKKYFETGSFPELNEDAVIHSLAESELVGLQHHDALRIRHSLKPSDDFFLASVSGIERSLFEKEPYIRLRGKGGRSVEIEGSVDYLELLRRLFELQKGISMRTLLAQLVLPKNVLTYNKKVREINLSLARLLERITNVQEEIDQLAFQTYSLTSHEVQLIKLAHS